MNTDKLLRGKRTCVFLRTDFCASCYTFSKFMLLISITYSAAVLCAGGVTFKTT